MSIHFSGAGPSLTQGLYTRQFAGKNARILSEVAEHMPAGLTLLTDRPPVPSDFTPLDLFKQDQHWMFREADGSLRVKNVSANADNGPLISSFPVRAEAMQTWLRGGNAYIGTDENDNPFALIGRSSVTVNGGDLKRLTADLGLKSPDDIVILPQVPNQFQYDIDTFTRPLGGKTVLVYDPAAGGEFLKREGLQRLRPLDEAGSRYYHETAKILESKGFKILRAPGMFAYEGRMSTGQTTRFNLSLLNAVVLENPATGKLVYLTMDPAKADLKERFAAWLQTECPDIEQVVYINGGPPVESHGEPFPNRMVEIFNRYKAGLHCLFAEVIDGPAWQAANR